VGRMLLRGRGEFEWFAAAAAVRLYGCGVFYLSLLLRCINALAIDMVGLSRCLLVLCVQAFVEGRR
jgi:hypothetical protein